MWNANTGVIVNLLKHTTVFFQGFRIQEGFKFGILFIKFCNIFFKFLG